MRRVTQIFLLALVAAAAGSLQGCNERLDDPLEGEGILTIEKIEPATVIADLSALDPNTGLPDQVNADIVVTMKNRPRSDAGGNFSDIFISKAERVCTFAGATIAQGTGAGGFTIPSGSSAGVTTTAVTVLDMTLSGAAIGDTWKCNVQFFGEDVAGNPVKSAIATFVVNFANI